MTKSSPSARGPTLFDLEERAAAPDHAKPAPKAKPRKERKPARAEPAPDPAPLQVDAVEPVEAQAAKAKAAPGRRATAQEMAAKQREISVSEFFTKNRHLLGFDTPLKALLTAVKEAVDNSLDACEEAGHPARDHRSRSRRSAEDRFRVAVEDNGPGIVKEQIAKIFGKLLYGSKFHGSSRRAASRASASPPPACTASSRPASPCASSRAPASAPGARVPALDRHRAEPARRPRRSARRVGRRTTARASRSRWRRNYQKGQRSVDMYLEQTAIANPHVTIRYTDPGRREGRLRARDEGAAARACEEIKPHPHGVELGVLDRDAQGHERALAARASCRRSSRASGRKVAEEICKLAKVSRRRPTRRASRARRRAALHEAIQKTKIMAPPTTCISPIGEELVLSGLKKELEADFYVATTRPPVGLPRQPVPDRGRHRLRQARRRRARDDRRRPHPEDARRSSRPRTSSATPTSRSACCASPTACRCSTSRPRARSRRRDRRPTGALRPAAAEGRAADRPDGGARAHRERVGAVHLRVQGSDRRTTRRS